MTPQDPESAELNGAHPRPPWLNWALLVVFATALCLPGLGIFARLGDAESTTENRQLAKWPSTSLGAVAWRDQVQEFCEDRFGGRDPLLRLHSLLHANVFRTPQVNRVVQGSSGWLYYGDGIRGGLEGHRPLSAARLRAWVDALDSRQRWATTLGARYVLLVCPDKHTIYPEHLPEGYGLPRSSPFDQLLEHLAVERPEIVVLDIRAALHASKPQRSLYWPRDSHWDSNGAFVGAQAVVDATRLWIPELAELSSGSVEEIDWPVVEQGLADMLVAPELYKHLPSRGVRARAGPAPLYRAEVDADSFGDALLPLLGIRFECVKPVPLSDLLRADVPRTSLVLDVIVERKLAAAAPTLPARSAQDLQRIEPAFHFRACTKELRNHSGREVGLLGSDPGSGATLTDSGLRLAGPGPVRLSPGAGVAGELGWTRLEVVVLNAPHTFEAPQHDGTRLVVLAPGVHALTFPSGRSIEFRVAQPSGAAVSLVVRRVELRAK